MASAARPISSEVVGDRPLISPDQVAALAEAIGMKVGLVEMAAESFSQKLQLIFLLAYDSFCMLMYLGSHL